MIFYTVKYQCSLSAVLVTSGEHFLFAAALAVAAGGDSDDQQDDGRDADDGEDLGELVHGGGLVPLPKLILFPLNKLKLLCFMLVCLSKEMAPPLMYLQGGKKSVKLFTYQANPFFLVFKRTLFQIFKVKTGRGERANKLTCSRSP